ncbi:MAG TPA: DUF177 domain-containing protein [Pyrinomonadaceae bacterium]|jgi:uncharacterized protein|nr:DUF177 domain-containing protein [Pyrinomonadaceae bacterium]
MFIDIADLAGAPKAFDIEIRPEDIDLDLDNVKLLRPVHVTGEAVQESDRTDIKGSIEYDAEIDCTRCLEPVGNTANFNFEVLFVAPENFAAGSDHQVEIADLDVDVLKEERIDLKQIVREQLLLNLPEQIFCKEDCKGICPKCGADRNLINCDCDETEIDPRWAALKNLK